MPIISHLDKLLAEKKMYLYELSEMVSISVNKLSMLKTGQARGIRFSTLHKLCKALNCRPGELLEYRKGSPEDEVDLDSDDW